MKAAIIGMLNNVGSSTSHHGGGYYHIMLNIIRDTLRDYEITVNPDPSTWNDYDRLYILEGVNYQENIFNFIGGPQPEHKVKLEAIANYKGLIINVNVPLDFNVFNKRFGIEHEFTTANTINIAKIYGLFKRKLVRGDSHSLSAWKPGFGIDRTDGKTLFGFLKEADPLIPEWNQKYDETITYFGNIDLRFHLMRQTDPKEATKELFSRYMEFSSKLTNNTVMGLLPIENESRKLPGTGLYLKKPFFGSREERMELREIAHDIIKQSGQKYYMWPEEWVDQDGTKMFEYMEPKQSVHLKPKYYMFAKEFIS